jgi:hypothetical protein
MKTLMHLCFVAGLICLGCGQSAVPSPEPVGSAEEALCSGGVVLRRPSGSGHSVVFDSFVIEDSNGNDSPDGNYGDGSTILAGLYNGPGTERDTFLYATLPAWSSVSSATWTLYSLPSTRPFNSVNPSGVLRMRTLTGTWDEDDAAASMPGQLGSGDGVTWNNAPSTTCDDPDESCVVATYTAVGGESSYTFDTTAYINQVLAGTVTDYGLYVDGTDGMGGYSDSFVFWASECAANGFGTWCSGKQPSLTLCP